MTTTFTGFTTPELESLYIEFMLADHARELAYDEMLTRRGDYIELYGFDMDADTITSTDTMFDLLNAIDNTDVEFWQFHTAVNQRYSNAAAAFALAYGSTEQLLRQQFCNQETNVVEIYWQDHQNEGLHQPERWTSKAQ